MKEHIVTLAIYLRQFYNYIKRHRLIIFALALIFLGGIIVYLFLDSLSLDYTIWGETKVDVAKTGAVGDFIAGVVGTILSFSGFILVYLTYNDQRRSNEKDKKEARIFMLIQIHVENANNAFYTNPYNHNGN